MSAGPEERQRKYSGFAEKEWAKAEKTLRALRGQGRLP